MVFLLDKLKMYSARQVPGPGQTTRAISELNRRTKSNQARSEDSTMNDTTIGN